MWRLTTDLVRRRWRDNFWLLLVGGFAGRSLALPGRPVGSATALAWCVGFFVGPILALGLSARELRLLPVSRRDIWRARWLIAVPAPTLLLALLLGVGVLIHRVPLTGREVLSICLVSFIYLGAFLGLGSRYPLTGWPDRWQIAGVALNVILGLILVGGPFWGFVFRQSLPDSWADVTRLQTWALAIGAALTLVGATYSPAEDAPLSRSRILPRKARRAAAVPRAIADGGVTGLALLARRTARTSLISLAMFLVLDALVFHSILDVSLAHWPPFVHADGQNLPMMLAFGLVAAVQNWKTGPQAIRHLRTLPLDDWQLTTWLLGLPVLQGLIWWTGIAAAHIVLGGWLSPLLRPDLFLTLIATSTLLTTAELLPKRGWLIVVAVIVTLPLATIDDDSRPGAVATLVLNGVAAAVIAAAMWTVRRGLLRSRALYQAVLGFRRFGGLPRAR